MSVSGPPTHSERKLLGVQSLAKAIGKAQAEATLNLLKLNVKEKIQALVYYANASNTVWNNGTAKLLKKSSIASCFTTQADTTSMSSCLEQFIPVCLVNRLHRRMRISIISKAICKTLTTVLIKSI